MSECSPLLTIILILFNLISIIVYKKNLKNKKKELGHYEAIADEHMIKLYNPTSDCWLNIIFLCVLGFQINCVVLLIIYFLLQKINNIKARLAFLQGSIDVLTIKQGLITVFPSFNAYAEVDQVDAVVKEQQIIYYFNGKEVYYEIINVENKTEVEIEDIRIWHLNKFRDYIRYIPQNIFTKENCFYDIKYWFAYLDEVRTKF